MKKEHPGKMLAEQLVIRKLTVDQLAEGTKVPVATRSDIIVGKASFTRSIATRLGNFFKKTGDQFTAGAWLYYQREYNQYVKALTEE